MHASRRSRSEGPRQTRDERRRTARRRADERCRTYPRRACRSTSCRRSRSGRRHRPHAQVDRKIEQHRTRARRWSQILDARDADRPGGRTLATLVRRRVRRSTRARAPPMSRRNPDRDRAAVAESRHDDRRVVDESCSHPLFVEPGHDLRGIDAGPGRPRLGRADPSPRRPVGCCGRACTRTPRSRRVRSCRDDRRAPTTPATSRSPSRSVTSLATLDLATHGPGDQRAPHALPQR